MNTNLKVSKRDGQQEPLDLDKIHKVVTWAAEGLNNVSVSEVELRAQLQFYDGMPTAEIHETLIKAAADLISEEAPDYQYLAARLTIFHLRKKAYGRSRHQHSMIMLKPWLRMVVTINTYSQITALKNLRL